MQPDLTTLGSSNPLRRYQGAYDYGNVVRRQPPRRRVHPSQFVLGDGLRLFPERGQTHRLTLVDSTTVPSGVTIQTYRPAGRATFGDAGE